MGIAVIDMSGRATLSNAEYRRFLPNGTIPSRDPENVARWRAWDGQGRMLPPHDWPCARALRGETVVPGQEMLFADKNGRDIWTAVATAPPRDVDDKVTGVVSVISDIDIAKRAQDALSESEERYRTLFESMDEAYAVVDVLKDEAGAWVDFRFVEVNPAFIAHTSMPWPVGQNCHGIAWRAQSSLDQTLRAGAGYRKAPSGPKRRSQHWIVFSTSTSSRWITTSIEWPCYSPTSRSASGQRQRCARVRRASGNSPTPPHPASGSETRKR